MTRRLFFDTPLLIGTLVSRLRADAAAEVWELLTKLASGLGEGSAAECSTVFDPKMPGIERLREGIVALLKDYDVQCAVEIMDSTGDERAMQVTLDWRMTVTLKSDVPRATRRNEKVRCKVENQGKKWRIVQFEPTDLLAPPKV